MKSDASAGFDWKTDINKELLAFLPRKTVIGATEQINGWITIEESISYAQDRPFGAISSVLVGTDFKRIGSFGRGWVGDALGGVTIEMNEGHLQFFGGILEDRHDDELEFLCGGSKPPGANAPQLIISPTYLWFWGAYKKGDGWAYLTPGGAEKPLIRETVTESGYKIEFRVAELRTFLSARRRKLLLQFEAFQTKEGHLDMDAIHEYSDDGGCFQYLQYQGGGDPVGQFSEKLEGYFYLHPQLGNTRPRLLDSLLDDDTRYGDFIVGVSSNGKRIEYSSNPDGLRNFFGANPDAPSYFTRVFFNIDVLDRYQASPTRYKVNRSRISCLNLWHIDISVNEHDLVVVYLGDLGKNLPSEEHQYWRAHNVEPEGDIDEQRFRRDMLGEWISSPDPMRDLKEKVESINDRGRDVFGIRIWRDVGPELERELECLVGPKSSDSAALGEAVLVLTKWLVDSLDGRAIRRQLNGPKSENQKVLENLRLLFEEQGWPTDVITALRRLQGLRSRGGIAHLSNSSSPKAREELGISGDDARVDFRIILDLLNTEFKDLLAAVS